MTTTAKAAAYLIDRARQVHISAGSVSAMLKAALTCECDVLEGVTSSGGSLMVVSDTGLVSLLIDVTSAREKCGVHIECKRLVQLRLESSAPEAVLVAARMLGGMAKTVD